MVKKGGLKRKIAIEKIEKKSSRGPCYSKRCNGLFSKASQLCLLSGAQIAVLATPMSENSNVSFFSFGHSSVDGLVSAYLSGARPLVPSETNRRMREDMAICLTQKDLGLGFWWQDEALTRSQNPKELSDAIGSMTKLLEDAKKLSSVNNHEEITNKDMKKSHQLVGNQEPEQTLNTTCCTPDESLNKTYDREIIVLDGDDCLPAENNLILSNNVEGFNNGSDTMEIDDIYKLIDFDSSFFDDFDFDNTLQEDHLGSDHATRAQDQPLTIKSISDDLSHSEIKANSQDFCIIDSNNNNASAVENLDQTLEPPAISDDILHNTNTMAYSQDFCIMDNNALLPAQNLDDIDMRDIDQLVDFGTPSRESFLSYDGFGITQELQEFADRFFTNSGDPSIFFDYEPVSDGDLVLQNKGFNDDHLHFSDVFNELTPLVTL